MYRFYYYRHFNSIAVFNGDTAFLIMKKYGQRKILIPPLLLVHFLQRGFTDTKGKLSPGYTKQKKQSTFTYWRFGFYNMADDRFFPVRSTSWTGQRKTSHSKWCQRCWKNTSAHILIFIHDRLLRTVHSTSLYNWSLYTAFTIFTYAW